MSAKNFMLREERATGHLILMKYCRHLRRLVDLEKRRLKELAEADASGPRSSGPTFVELTSPVLVGKECRFELDNGSGATMRVQLVGYDAAELEALSRSFWDAL
jgi:hypothetical protein